MRYNIILTVSLLCFALMSCVREEMVENLAGAEGTQITISASIRNAPGTKTYMGDEVASPTNYYPIYWHDNEKIALFSKKSIGVFTLSSVRSDNRDIADFTGDAGDMPIKFEGSDVYPAAYPVDNAFARIDEDGNLHVGSYLPFQQPYRDNTFSDDVFPMAAASASGEDFEFYNLCGVLQIPVKGTEDGQEIRSVYLSGNNGEIVAGGIGMVFDPNTGVPVADEVTPAWNGKKIATYGDEGYTRIIVNFDEPLVLNTSETKYINIAVIPQKFSNGIKVEMMDAKNMGISMVTAGEIDIKRSVLTRLTVLEYVEPEPAQVANSYVYSEAGYYLMPAYAMGNRMDVTLPTEGRKLAADLLWSELITVNHNTTERTDLIPAVTNIEYIPSEDGFGMLQFRINKDSDSNPYRGNAAIALYDADTKEVIWSWHVWMCEPVHDVITGGTCADGTYTYELPDGTKMTYAAEASSGNLIIMDRNLGAISADPADGWKTYGLYYQNGRRDPFIGGHWDGDPAAGTRMSYSGENLPVREDETTSFSVGVTDTAPVWYNTELAPDGWNYLNRFQNVSTALRFPMTFSSGLETSGNGQWTLYSYADNQEWLDPAAGTQKKGSTTTGGLHGSTGLSDGGHEAYWNRTKTIMDPCPVGYSILGERGGLFLNSDSKTYIFNETQLNAYNTANPDKPISTTSGHGVYGMMSSYTYGGKTYRTWWPAAGVRTITGKLGDVGYRGMYFHYDHIKATHGGHGSGFNNGTEWKTGIMTNHAASVRCVREKQDISKYPLK